MSNNEVINRLQKSRPILLGVVPASSAIANYSDVTVLHAGPPIDAPSMPGPMRGAVIGALIYEGIERQDAERLVADGGLDLRPCHDSGFVGPMAGVVTPRMPVWAVKDDVYGNRSFSTLNEGLGKVLRFGANDEEAIRRLAWIENTLGPVMDAALQRHGGLNLKDFLAENLRRGDELHNRNKAATSSFVREFAGDIAAVAGSDTGAIFAFLHKNDHFCLNMSIAASKCSADAAHAVGVGSVVTAMASNGRDFGIRLSGLGDRWLTAPAGRAKGRYFPGYSQRDAALDMGDSYISEVVGLGGFAMAAAPAIAAFVGGKSAEFAALTEEMYGIVLSEHEQFRIPSLDYRGVPLGIDAMRVMETRILPVLNSGIAHKDPGVGQIGAGITHPPLDCFLQFDEITRLASAAIGDR